MLRPPPSTTLFPYTTLFRSLSVRGVGRIPDLPPARILRARAACGRGPVFCITLRRTWDCPARRRSEEHTSELQSQSNLVCRLLLEKKKKKNETNSIIYLTYI